MAQRLSTSFVNTNIPGAYVETTVKSTPVGITSTGDIVIIGEAAGGAKYSDEDLKENWFTPDQLDRVTSKYISGTIVDAFRGLSSPSSDAEIVGSANRIGSNGSNGILIISYTTGTINATGGTITTSGGNTIHTFTSNGNFIILSFSSNNFFQFFN